MEKVTFEPRWVESARAGDQDALTGLYKSTYYDVYLTIKMLLRHDEDTVMDLLQDTYIKAFTKLDTLGDDSKFPAWVSTIARNKALDYLKKKKPILFTETLDEYGEVVWEPKETNISVLPEDAMDQKDTSEIFSEILDTIPEKQRIVITMYYYMEMSQPLIARTLGISEGTVTSRLYYGKKAIESKIYEVEKRDGIRLHAIAPFTFFLWLLQKEDSHAMEPDSEALSNILSLSHQVDSRTPKFDGEHDLNKKQTANTDAASASSEGVAGNTSSGITGKAVKSATRAAGATATKSTGIKIVATIAAIGVIGGGAAYGVYRFSGMQEAEDAQVSEEGVAAGLEDSTDNTAEAESTNPEVIYTEVLDYYYNSIITGWVDFDWENNSNSNTDISYMFPRFYSDPSYIDQIGYAFIDLNGDGVDELLIGMTSDEETYRRPGTIYDLFTYMNGQIYDVATSGERFRYQLCSDNTIYFSSHDGAGFDRYAKYTLNDLEPVFDINDYVYSEADAGVNNIYWYHTTTGTDNPIDYTLSTIPDGTAITEDEADSIRNEWSQPADYELTYFGDYTPVEDNVTDETPNFDYTEVVNTYKSIINKELSVNDASFDLSGTGLWDAPYGGTLDDEGYITVQHDTSIPFYYTLYDINADGTDELLIIVGSGYTPNAYNILDVFSFYSNEPSLIISGLYRYEIDLCKNGMIRSMSHGGAELQEYSFYDLNNGELEEKQTALEDWGTYYINDNPCTKEELYDYLESYEIVDLNDLELKYIGDCTQE